MQLVKSEKTISSFKIFIMVSLVINLPCCSQWPSAQLCVIAIPQRRTKKRGVSRSMFFKILYPQQIQKLQPKDKGAVAAAIIVGAHIIHSQKPEFSKAKVIYTYGNFRIGFPFFGA